MSLSEKIIALKASQEARVNKFNDFYVAEWDLTLQFKRLTLSDQKKAEAWAKKNYKKDYLPAQGAAMVCLSCVNGVLPLNTETVDFLLSEPVAVLAEVIAEVQQVNGVIAKE